VCFVNATVFFFDLKNVNITYNGTTVNSNKWLAIPVREY
jgi:hypothetical protein